jgi:hypothetical protein
MYISALLKQLYQVKDHKNCDFKTTRGKVFPGTLTHLNNFQKEDDEPKAIFQKIDNQEASPSLKNMLKVRGPVTLTEGEVSTVLKNLVNRKRFKYEIWDSFVYLLRCLCMFRLNPRKFRGTK